MGRPENRFGQIKYRGTATKQKQTNEIGNYRRMQQKMNKVYTLDIHIYICKISSHWAGDTVTDEVEDREAFRSIFLRFKLLGAFTAESSATEMASPAST